MYISVIGLNGLVAGKRWPNPSKLRAEAELQSHVEWTASLESGTSCEVDKPAHRPGRPVRREVGHPNNGWLSLLGGRQIELSGCPTLAQQAVDQTSDPVSGLSSIQSAKPRGSRSVVVQLRLGASNYTSAAGLVLPAKSNRVKANRRIGSGGSD